MTKRLGSSVLALFTASILALAGCEAGTSDADIRIMTLAEARQLHAQLDESPDRVVFIDPRPTRAFQAARIPGAIHLEIPDLPPDSPRSARLRGYSLLVVYGDNPSDALAKAMTKRLIRNKYPAVRWFAGGLSEWTASGGAVETIPPQQP